MKNIDSNSKFTVDSQIAQTINGSLQHTCVMSITKYLMIFSCWNPNGPSICQVFLQFLD